MEKITDISDAQWLSLAQRVTAGLQARKGDDDPLELSYEEVALCLGYTREVEFYRALQRCHHQQGQAAGFWFFSRRHRNHRRNHLPEALLFYRNRAETPMAPVPWAPLFRI
jgi:hypothetical protein